MPSARHRLLNFDIDTYIDSLLPSSPIPKLPRPIAHFLGHRDGAQKTACTVVRWFWTFIGSFAGIALIAGVYRHAPALQSLSPPVVIGSFGAAAVLEYNTIESPLAQPRNVIFGQLISSVIGVGITKLFLLLPHARFEDLRWLAGALAVATSSVTMSVTKTVHPPAGATALLAATSSNLTNLGWNLVPLVVLADVLMIASACLVNNIQRQFPIYWWTPTDLPTKPKPKPESKRHEDVEKAAQSISSGLDEYAKSDTKYTNDADEQKYWAEEPEIRITNGKIFVPESMELDDWQRDVLKILQTALREDRSPTKEERVEQ